MSGDGLALLAFAVVAATAALWFLRMYQVRIPENRAGFVGGWLGGAALGGVALASGTSGWTGTAPAILALAIGGFLTLLVLISRQKASAEGVTLGAPLLRFEAPDEDAAMFDVATLSGRPILLKFFRGHW